MATTKGGKKPSTEVTKPKGGAVSTNVRPVGRGFEEGDADSYAIPFLGMLQKLSPQCDSDEPEYIKGARPGMFFNTITKELFEEVELIPCVYQRRFNRWAPIDSGGGFKGVFLPSAINGMEASNAIKMSEEGRWFFPGPDGEINEKKNDTLTDTRMHFCLLLNDGVLDQVLVSLSRTQLKKSKNWMSNMQRKGGDMFENVYIAKSVDEENDKGKWKGWSIDFSREASQEEQEAGELLYTSVSAGKVKVKMDDAAD